LIKLIASNNLNSAKILKNRNYITI